MILFSTLLNRTLWLNPLSDILGGWSIFDIDPSSGDTIISIDGIENVIMFIPFVFMFCSIYDAANQDTNINKFVAMRGFKISILFSCTIEFLQLFLRVGTFQISDLVYNSLGGFVGCLVYQINILVKKRKNKHYKF